MPPPPGAGPLDDAPPGCGPPVGAAKLCPYCCEGVSVPSGIVMIASTCGWLFGNVEPAAPGPVAGIMTGTLLAPCDTDMCAK